MNISPDFNDAPYASRRERLLNLIVQHKSNYWFGFLSDPLTVLFLIFWDATISRGNVYAATAVFVFGLFVWTFVEYCFHRWVYHSGGTLAHEGHNLHHEEPEELIGMPWFLTTSVIFTLWYAFAHLLGISFASSFIAGFLSGFFFYYSLHHVHHHRVFRGAWYRKLRAHHKIHHQIEGANFGVTNRFWDQVFGTTHRRGACASAGKSDERTKRAQLKSSEAGR